MHHGEIVERGTHRELIGRGGIYARLSLMQSVDIEGGGPTEEKTLQSVSP
jgi:hypothetical protein